MPYCTKKIIIDIEQTSLMQVLNKMAVTKFKAHRATCLNNGNVNIDGGLNDVRAVLSDQVDLIKFCCRYTRDVPRVESLISDFVYENYNCKLA
jgi:hypothetical protein